MVVVVVVNVHAFVILVCIKLWHGGKYIGCIAAEHLC